MEQSAPGVPAGARPSARFVWGLCALLLVHHFGLWAWTAWHRGFPLLAGLDHWDSGHYSTLVTRGYATPLWAFLPLYPLTVKLVSGALGGGVPPQVLGCVLSTGLLVAFVAWVHQRASRREVLSPLEPRTRWGWFFFLFSPASFALHSHHTEALFLLLSLGAFACAWEGHFWRAAVFAGLCVWTRNQGVFVAIVAALLLAERVPGSARQRLLRFAGLGFLSLAAYGGMILFEWRASGDPLAHLHSQSSWPHVDSAWGALRTLWLGNPHQDWDRWEIPRALFSFLLLGGSLALARVNRPLGLYGVLSFAVMLPQGEFANALRFGAVLFPVLFLLGDALAARPAWLRWSVAILAFWANHKITHGFVNGFWAY
ncbi:hypothetical protein F0U62_24150 [Cystobacter fuscus]|uniref:mannosyltransferase family protein n=1 Tax=Cystobacter fuscus TaxID=43 RepID=UPI002B2A109B|nr:hypothetical protein F0U62_24150 [Cystobacter fuscus]